MMPAVTVCARPCGQPIAIAKSPTRSASRGSSTERENPFVRANSIKAWKEEQDKIKAEEDAKEREKELKRLKSAEKKKVRTPRRALQSFVVRFIYQVEIS